MTKKHRDSKKYLARKQSAIQTQTEKDEIDEQLSIDDYDWREPIDEHYSESIKEHDRNLYGLTEEEYNAACDLADSWNEVSSKMMAAQTLLLAAKTSSMGDKGGLNRGIDKFFSRSDLLKNRAVEKMIKKGYLTRTDLDGSYNITKRGMRYVDKHFDELMEQSERLSHIFEKAISRIIRARDA